MGETAAAALPPFYPPLGVLVTMISVFLRETCRPRLVFLLLLLPLIAAGCHPAMQQRERSHPGDAPFLLYLHVMPAEAARLRLTLSRVAAIDENGGLRPLVLHLPEVTSETVNRQRLLASGRLPAGFYRGISVVFNGAWTRSEEGEAALHSGSEPLEVPALFVIEKGGGGLLELAYQHEGSIDQRFMFTPRFAAYAPERPLLGRTGILGAGRADYLTILDRKTLKVHGLFGTGGRIPAGAVIDERQRRIYVAIKNADLVEVLDLVSGEPVGRILLQPGDQPGHLALSPDGLLLLVACTGANSVLLLDARTQMELARVDTGEEPVYILPDRRGQRAYVISERADAVTVLDLNRYRPAATILMEAGPYRAALNRDGSRLYVLHHGSPYLSVLDTRSLGLLERLPVGPGGSSLLIDPRTDLLYLGRKDENRVDVFDLFSLLPVDFLEGAGGAVDMAIDDEENRLLMVVPDKGLVAVDLTSRKVTGRLEAAPFPRFLSVAGARR